MGRSAKRVITISKGLDLPITGAPQQVIETARPVTQVALLGHEYVGMKPTMLVEKGERVRTGQALFEDKKNPGVRFTAPASGVVTAINRGDRRALLSVVITLEGDGYINFGAETDLDGLSREAVQQKLLDSGLWVALRTRPFSRAPKPGSHPAALFITVTDTNPLAADPRVVIADAAEDFAAGLQVLSHLTDGPLYLCQDGQAQPLPGSELPRVQSWRFAGVHPAGLVGTHIHYLAPVSLERQVWHIGYQDVIAVGQLFTTGELNSSRVIALAGPQVKNPRLLRTLMGAKASELVAGELQQPEMCRVVSGSVLNGFNATAQLDYLSRFRPQLSVLLEDHHASVLPWVRPGKDLFSVTGAVLSHFLPRRLFPMTTHSGGAKRAMLAFGQLERVMPLDILPTLLVRDLLVQDTDEAQQLGALELDEEDLALCTFVCPSKYDYGQALRTCLTIIEREG
ncbi:Na(+)-translocating NADH-quinone reductase subunit A [Shewanella sp. YIC-542]|uniref:Na(+)-translocating NADH-quinone reductase subunit A n=1 Tax=Shewanella mytili TaxID=3377111 RepID=UPI00398EF081